MRQGYRQESGHRAAVAAGVVLLHGLAAVALLTGSGLVPAATGERALLAFDLPVPPRRSVPPPAPAPKQPRGAAAPANRHAQPTEVVAAPPRIVLPAPIPAAPIAGSGPEATAGAAPLPGPGTGAGGAGEGTGSGTSGAGSGSGGGIRATLLHGTIRDADYPRAARRTGSEGAVTVRFTVGTGGRATGCAVVQSSGSAELDDTTCRLIETRYRYRPARDGDGRPIAETRGWRQQWWLEPRH